MTRTAVILFALIVSGCSQKTAPVVINVGDPAAEAFQKLKDQGHRVALIPLDTRIQVCTPTPEGGSKSEVVGSTVPYDINGRIVLFGNRFSDKTITSIQIGNQSLSSLEVPKAIQKK